MITNAAIGHIVYYWKDGKITEGRVIGYWIGSSRGYGTSVIPTSDGMTGKDVLELTNEQIYATRSEAEKAITANPLTGEPLLRIEDKCFVLLNGNIREGTVSNNDILTGVSIDGYVIEYYNAFVFPTREACQAYVGGIKPKPFRKGDRVCVVAEGETVSGTIIALIDNSNVAYIQFDMPIRSEHNPAVIKWRWWYPFNYLTIESKVGNNPVSAKEVRLRKLTYKDVGKVSTIWYENKPYEVKKYGFFGLPYEQCWRMEAIDPNEKISIFWHTDMPYLYVMSEADKPKYGVGDRIIVVATVWGEEKHGRVLSISDDATFPSEGKRFFYRVELDSEPQRASMRLAESLLRPEARPKASTKEKTKPKIIRKLFGRYNIEQTEDGINITGYSPSDNTMVDISKDVIKVNGKQIAWVGVVPDMEPDKRCGTCASWETETDKITRCKCNKQWMKICQDVNAKQYSFAMFENDGQHCPDWTPKDADSPNEENGGNRR